MANADWELWRACARVLPKSHGFFDASIFAAVESDDGESAVVFHPFRDIAQEGVDGVEFAVDFDAYGLKNASGWVWFSGARRAQYGTAHASEVERRIHFAAPGGIAYFSGQWSRLSNVAELVEDIGEFVLFDLSEVIARGESRLTHSHIEWGIGVERESARFVVDLMRRQAEIGQDAVESAAGLGIGDAGLAQRRVEMFKRRLKKVFFDGERSEPGLCGALRGGVAIESVEDAIGRNLLRHGAGVACAAEREIEISIAWGGREIS